METCSAWAPEGSSERCQEVRFSIFIPWPGHSCRLLSYRLVDSYPRSGPGLSYSCDQNSSEVM